MYGKTGENNWRAFFNPISHFICTNITERTGKGNNVPTYVVAYSMHTQFSANKSEKILLHKSIPIGLT